MVAKFYKYKTWYTYRREFHTSTNYTHFYFTCYTNL